MATSMASHSDPWRSMAARNLHPFDKFKLPRSYLEHAARGGTLGAHAEVAAADLPFEFMMNALRLNDGVARALVGERTGLAPDAIAATLEAAIGRGWLERDAARLRATGLGRRWLNDVIALFLP